MPNGKVYKADEGLQNPKQIKGIETKPLVIE
jgi:hypothetical protein